MLAPPKVTDPIPTAALDEPTGPTPGQPEATLGQPAPPETAPGQPPNRIQGVFEPPSGFLLTAIARNKLLILAVAVLCALIGVGIGTARKPTYTATATLQVGQVNPNSPGFLGYVQSASALATAFSRAISAEPVLATVQHKLHVASSAAAARLSAEPLPLAPAFLVIATGKTESAAIQLANVAAGAVIAYESQSNSANPEAESLLHEYHEASFQLQQAEAALAHLNLGKDVPISVRARVEAARNTAAVKLRAIGVAYTAAIASRAPRSGLVSLVASAVSASNNRKSKIELLGFIGLLAGIIIGCAAAALREQRRRSRLLAGG